MKKNLKAFGPYLAEDNTDLKYSKLESDIENTFKKRFKKSAMAIKIDDDSIVIKFSLGANKNEYSSGIIHNDPIHTHIWGHLFNLNQDGTFSKPVRFDTSMGGGLMVKSKNPALAYDNIKVWRAFTAKDTKSLIASLDKYFQKLHATIKANLNNLGSLPFDPKTKL